MAMIATAANGAAGMKIRFTRALSPARATPTTRATELPNASPPPVIRSTTPRIRWTQPQVV